MTNHKQDMAVAVMEKMRGGEGQAILTTLAAERPQKIKMFTHVRLTPGSTIGYHTHEGETELYYFIAGTGRVSDDGEYIDVNPGDSMCTPSGHGHAVENTGSEDMEILAVVILD